MDLVAVTVLTTILASTTRSASPSLAEDVEVVGGGKSLRMEKSEKQNQLEGQPEKRYVIGTRTFQVRTRILLGSLSRPPR